MPGKKVTDGMTVLSCGDMCHSRYESRFTAKSHWLETPEGTGSKVIKMSVCPEGMRNALARHGT